VANRRLLRELVLSTLSEQAGISVVGETDNEREGPSYAKRFKIFKFRTMFVNSSDVCNSQHTCRSDARITPFGSFLRKTSLDELPPFLNVLHGEMSVVGPGPELTFFVQKFRNEILWYMSRHNVRICRVSAAQPPTFACTRFPAMRKLLPPFLALAISSKG
jgi:sugar transferase